MCRYSNDQLETIKHNIENRLKHSEYKPLDKNTLSRITSISDVQLMLKKELDIFGNIHLLDFIGQAKLSTHSLDILIDNLIDNCIINDDFNNFISIIKYHNPLKSKHMTRHNTTFSKEKSDELHRKTLNAIKDDIKIRLLKNSIEYLKKYFSKQMTFNDEYIPREFFSRFYSKSSFETDFSKLYPMFSKDKIDIISEKIFVGNPPIYVDYPKILAPTCFFEHYTQEILCSDSFLGLKQDSTEESITEALMDYTSHYFTTLKKADSRILKTGSPNVTLNLEYFNMSLGVLDSVLYADKLDFPRLTLVRKLRKYKGGCTLQSDPKLEKKRNYRLLVRAINERMLVAPIDTLWMKYYLLNDNYYEDNFLTEEHFQLLENLIQYLTYVILVIVYYKKLTGIKDITSPYVNTNYYLHDTLIDFDPYNKTLTYFENQLRHIRKDFSPFFNAFSNQL